MTDKKYKNRDWLNDQYTEQEKSTTKIGREENVNASTIWHWLRKLNIPIRDMGHAVHLATNKNSLRITQPLLSFLEGELLGDGCIVWRWGQHSARYSHSSEYLRYLNWLSAIFASYGLQQGGKIYELSFIGRKGEYKGYRYRSLSYPALGELRRHFYPNGKKIVPKDFMLNPIKARQWYIGDGYIRIQCRKPSITLYTCDFDRDSIEILREQLRLNLIDSTYHPSSNSIYLGVKSAPAFLDYIGPCSSEIEDIYGYKWGR